MEFFGEFNWPVFIEVLPNYLVALATVGLIFVVHRQLKSAREDAAKRAAFDFNFSVFRGERHVMLLGKYNKIRKNWPRPELLLKYKPKDEEKDKAIENTIAVLYEYLSFQEMFAIGVLNGGICEKYAKEGSAYIIQEDWKFLKKFVESVRSGESDTLYVHFEQLSRKWK